MEPPVKNNFLKTQQVIIGSRLFQLSKKIALEQLEKERDAIWSAATRIVLNANPKDINRRKVMETTRTSIRSQQTKILTKAQKYN